MNHDTIPCGPPDGCCDFEIPRAPDSSTDFAQRMLALPGGLGALRQTTPQADAVARGLKRFNARGCK